MRRTAALGGLQILLAVVGCDRADPGPGGSSTGSESSSSSGSSSSSSGGMPVDAGPVDGGLWVQLQRLRANPNNVLSLIVDAYGSEGAVAAWVEFAPVAADGGALPDAGSALRGFKADGGYVPPPRLPVPGITPSFAFGGQAITLPVLGLVANTTYAVEVAVAAAGGQTATSDALRITTGAIPEAVGSYASFAVSPSGAVAPGYLALSKLDLDSGRSTPSLIIDRDANVIWYAMDLPPGVGDFQKQPNGTYTIAVAGAPFPGVNAAVWRRVDVLGNLVAEYLSPNPDAGTDPHEFRDIPDSGDYLFMDATVRDLNLSAYDGGSDEPVVGNTIYRMHPDAGVAFSWNTFDYTTPGNVDPACWPEWEAPVDETHANSIDIASDGNYLVSSRNMSQVWKINAESGALMWTLGRHGDFAFRDDPLEGFSGQHTVRELAPNDLLLFDDGDRSSFSFSRAVEYQLSFVALADGGTVNEAELVWSYTPDPLVFANSMGSTQRLSNGDTLINYGTVSRIDEVDAQGNLVWELIDPQGITGIYRAQLIETLY